MTTKDNEGLTPLDMAKKSESKECVQLIQKSQEPEEETANDEDKSPKEEELEVEVHESTNTPSSSDHEEEENNNIKSQDTDEQDKADNSSGEKMEDKVPIQKKKKKRISFLLPGDQEPIPIDNEQEQCEDIIPEEDEILLTTENVEQAETAIVTDPDPDKQLPEPTVSRRQVVHMAASIIYIASYIAMMAFFSC